MPPTYSVMPYSFIVGQDEAKLALELAFISPALGGVLLSGQRGTGKSTLVRAFSAMLYGRERPPVTIPINATIDRVVGGWDLLSMMTPPMRRQKGLLEEANGRILYVDEVNLLENYIVNSILDAASSQLLTIEREGLETVEVVHFVLVGTMNPEEGGLRPQLLDRFGLMVHVGAEDNADNRMRILGNVLAFQRESEQSADGALTPALADAYRADEEYATRLRDARSALATVTVPDGVLRGCAAVSSALNTQGNRGELNLARAAHALAALQGAGEVTTQQVETVAPLALQHRRNVDVFDEPTPWTPENTEQVKEALNP